MEIVVWIAMAVLATSQGPQVITSDTIHPTKAACEAEQAAAEKQLRAHPKFDEILGMGLSCVEVAVKEVAHAATPKTLPKMRGGPTQRDLEKATDPAHASPFRSTSL